MSDDEKFKKLYAFGHWKRVQETGDRVADDDAYELGHTIRLVEVRIAVLKTENACNKLRISSHETEMDQVLKENERLKYVPGHFECKKCGFGLVSKTIYMGSGTIGANTKPQECGNGCGPMWRIAWADYCKSLDTGYLAHFERQETELTRLRSALESQGKQAREALKATK